MFLKRNVFKFEQRKTKVKGSPEEQHWFATLGTGVVQWGGAFADNLQISKRKCQIVICTAFNVS